MHLAEVHLLISDTNKLGFLINIFSKFGWHTGQNLYEHIREELARQTGSPDLTFYQVNIFCCVHSNFHITDFKGTSKKFVMKNVHYIENGDIYPL